MATYNDIDRDYPSLVAVRKACVRKYKAGDYWTVDTIYHGSVKDRRGRHAGTIYYPEWVGFATPTPIPIWVPAKPRRQGGHDISKARFVKADGTLGPSATAIYKAHRRS